MPGIKGKSKHDRGKIIPIAISGLATGTEHAATTITVIADFAWEKLCDDATTIIGNLLFKISFTKFARSSEIGLSPAQKAMRVGILVVSAG